MQKISSGLITVIILACSTLTHAAQSSPTEIKQPTSGNKLKLAEPISSHRFHGTPQTKPLQPPRLKKTHTILPNIQLNKSTPAQNMAAKAACNIDAFATSNSATLISQIKSQGVECVNELFNTQPSIQVLAFSSDHMVAVASHAVGLSAAYSGGGDANILSIFRYLYAAYFIAANNDNINFNEQVQPAVKLATDAFVNNSHFYDDDDAHGPVLAEVIDVMYNASLGDIYLPVVKQWLSRWNSSYKQKPKLALAMSSLLDLLEANENDDIETLVGSDLELVSILAALSMQDWMLDPDLDLEYLISNVGRSLGLLKAYTDTPIQASVDTALKAIFETYEFYGRGDAVWLAAAGVVTYYGNCADYSICDYAPELTTLVLSQSYNCSDTLKIRSQSLNIVQQQSACSALATEESYFHTKMETDNMPVVDDKNFQLQVNVFEANYDYEKYGDHIFPDLDTDSGGYYLEGDPSQVDNVPHLIVYEQENAKAHNIHNLEHEYAHYLDGRFNFKGDFGAPTVLRTWWSEGVAEYISLQDQNHQAYKTIYDGSTYDLITIFASTYAQEDEDRLYQWGYLAVRFIVETHFDELQMMRKETRAGEWKAFKTRVDNWASDYNEEFTSWIFSIPAPANIPPIASFSIDCSELVCNFNGEASDDEDGYIETVVWDFGDGQTADDNDFILSHTYSKQGTYSVSLTVTDDKGAAHSSMQSVTVTGAEPNISPVASFSIECSELICNFDGDASDDYDGYIETVVWDFGDGQTADDNDFILSHTYSKQGTYSVSLTVTDDKGAAHSVSQSVTLTAGGGDVSSGDS